MIDVSAGTSPGQMAILVTAAVMAIFDVLALAGAVPASLRPVVAAVCTAVVPLLLGLWGYQHHQTQLQAQRISAQKS